MRRLSSFLKKEQTEGGRERERLWIDVIQQSTSFLKKEQTKGGRERERLLIDATVDFLLGKMKRPKERERYRVHQSMPGLSAFLKKEVAKEVRKGKREAVDQCGG